MLLIKKYRLAKNITLRELSVLSDCSYGYLSQLENGKRRNPSWTLIKKIAHALRICPMTLLGGYCSQFCSPKCYYYDKYFD
ncbi:helix-turn-helix domain-containing protein [Clostridium sp. Mt-5]|uniref:Helix-turn-helix domain-containing protein n=1 Tax=Clostridium moutaii TaxID=3240932 RepID=A0ABV4BS81_9CLOT